METLLQYLFDFFSYQLCLQFYYTFSLNRLTVMFDDGFCIRWIIDVILFETQFMYKLCIRGFTLWVVHPSAPKREN